VKTIADTLGVARSNLVAQASAAAPRRRRGRGRQPQPEAELLAEIKETIAWPAELWLSPSACVDPARAARAADVSGLPPTYISVGGLDLFLEENLTYADRLSRAGVPVELHMYPRAYHGFYRATNARVTRQAEHDTREALRCFLHG
jgi:acetyl esterase/lipase